MMVDAVIDITECQRCNDPMDDDEFVWNRERGLYVCDACNRVLNGQITLCQRPELFWCYQPPAEIIFIESRRERVNGN